MEKYPVWDMSGQVGRLWVEASGLYASLTAELPDGGNLVRLWLTGESEPVLLGTPIPEDGCLRCRRQISRRQLPRGLAGAIALAGEPGIWQEHGELRLRLEGAGMRIAAPYQEDGPIRQIEHYPQMCSDVIDGRLYLVRRCSLEEWFSEQNQTDSR